MQHPRPTRRTGLALMLLLSAAIAAYALRMYGLGPGAQRLHPDMRATFERHALAIHTHIIASAVALLLGPLQFSARLRARWPAWHRWSGRLYLGVGVGLGGAAGLYMSQHAFGGPVARLGFAGLALAWLFTGATAFAAARRRDFAAHRRWMIRNFALTFAAVTLRLYLPPVFALGLPFAGRKVARGCVILLLAEEDGEEIQRRFGAVAKAMRLTPEQIAEVAPAIHPVVTRHAETGRRGLFVSEHFSTRILDLPEDESRDLLAQLFDWSTRPRLVYRHRWQAHDLVFWDNRSLIHLATGCPAHLRHKLYRTTIQGDAPF